VSRRRQRPDRGNKLADPAARRSSYFLHSHVSETRRHIRSHALGAFSIGGAKDVFVSQFVTAADLEAAGATSHAVRGNGSEYARHPGLLSG
jgi:hypothetical protein